MFNIGVNSAIVTRFTSEVVRGGSTGIHVTGCDVIKYHVIGSEHVRMRNRKLRNIHLSGAFSPEATSSNVT